MSRLVIYDSLYGNTETIARAIARGLGPDATVLVVGEASAARVHEAGLLVIGSPTQAGRPTPTLKAFIERLPADALEHKAVAAFDTRVGKEGKGVVGRFFINVLGYAAGRIGQRLQKRGAHLIATPEGFLVMGTQGPLLGGEEERAREWGEVVGRLVASVPAAP